MGIEVATKQDFDLLFQQIKEANRKVDLLIQKSKAVRVITVNDVAKMEGVSVQYIYKHKYLAPRFMESAYPDGSKRWSFEEYLAWAKIDPNERKAMYEQHLKELKDKYVEEFLNDMPIK